MPSRASRLLLFLILTTVLIAQTPAPTSADDWSQWRGPRRDGVSTEAGLLKKWPEGGPRLAWKSGGVGSGYASISTSSGRLFTLGKRGSNEVRVSALSVTAGKVLWSTVIGASTRIPTSTPVVDGPRVYALDPDGQLACLSAADGKLVWKRHLARDFGGRLQSGRGYGESPLIDGDRLICTPGAADAALVALDKLTGSVVWKTRTPELGPSGRDGAGFSSVVVSNGAGRKQYVQLLGRGLVGVDAATGAFLWGYNGIANGTANIPTPIVHGDYVFSANGYNAGSVLLRLSSGGPTGIQAEPVYTLSGSRFQNHHGGVIRVGEHLYGGHGSNNGLPTCLEFATGRVVWKDRGVGVGSAAISFADERFYFRYQNGVVALLQAGPSGYSVEGTLLIGGAGGDSWSHPVVSNGRLYLREQDTVFAYDIRAAPTVSRLSGSERPTPSVLVARELGMLNRAGLKAVVAPGRADDRFLRIQTTLAERLTAPQLLVQLPARLLEPGGTIAPAATAALRALRSPYALSAAGTRLGAAGLRQLETALGLVRLDLTSCPAIGESALSCVATFPRLQALTLAVNDIPAEGLARLVNAPHLKVLDLDVCESVGDQACEVIGRIRGLEALILKKTGFETVRVSDVGLKALSGLQELRWLDLYGSRVTDAGIGALASLPKLKCLDLSLVALTDRGIAQLANLPELQELSLVFSEGFAGPKVGETGLAALIRANQLRRLDLTGSRLPDQALVGLTRLTSLTHLRLLRTGVSTDVIRELRVKLPGCDVSN